MFLTHIVVHAHTLSITVNNAISASDRTTIVALTSKSHHYLHQSLLFQIYWQHSHSKVEMDLDSSSWTSCACSRKVAISQTKGTYISISAWQEVVVALQPQEFYSNRSKQSALDLCPTLVHLQALSMFLTAAPRILWSRHRTNDRKKPTWKPAGSNYFAVSFVLCAFLPGESMVAQMVQIRKAAEIPRADTMAYIIVATCSLYGFLQSTGAIPSRLSLYTLWVARSLTCNCTSILDLRDWYQRIQEDILHKILYLLSKIGERSSQQ